MGRPPSGRLVWPWGSTEEAQEVPPTPLPAVAQPLGPSRSGASRGDGRGGLCPIDVHIQPHLGEEKGGASL